MSLQKISEACTTLSDISTIFPLICLYDLNIFLHFSTFPWQIIFFGSPSPLCPNIFALRASVITTYCISFAANAANVVPDVVSLNNTNTFGVYQVGHSIVLYNEPDENSGIKKKIVWDKENVIPQDLTKPDLFVLYLEKQDFALMAVTDETEDWVEVIYNGKTGETGWIKKDDPYKFNTWVNFYSMYLSV